MGRPEKVLTTSWGRLQDFPNQPARDVHCTSDKDVPWTLFQTYPGHQIGTPPGFSKKIYKGRPRDVSGEPLCNVLGINICRLDNYFKPVLSLLLITNLYFVSFGILAYKNTLSISCPWFRLSTSKYISTSNY